MCSALRTAILCREVYMSELKMIAPAVPNVPWQDKPEGGVEIFGESYY